MLNKRKEQSTFATAEPPLLEIRGLSISLGGQNILENINLDFQGGKIHALIGPNGAGKTTLIRGIMGSMPHLGTIRLNFRKEQRIGYVPQLLGFDHTLPITESTGSGRNTARSALGGEFPSCTLSVYAVGS